MRVIIAGGRDWEAREVTFRILDEIAREIDFEVVLCGMASGADLLGRDWANERDIHVEEYPADWRTYGRSAGPRRNEVMSYKADAVVLFPGGAGTANMLEHAKARNLRIFVINTYWNEVTV